MLHCNVLPVTHVPFGLAVFEHLYRGGHCGACIVPSRFDDSHARALSGAAAPCGVCSTSLPREGPAVARPVRARSGAMTRED